MSPLRTFLECVGLIAGRAKVELPYFKEEPFFVSPARSDDLGRPRRATGLGPPSLREGHHAIQPCPWSKKPRRAPGRAAIAPTINDLAIRAGTVNGSGSQSANLVILRSLYAMGIPCGGRSSIPLECRGPADVVSTSARRRAPRDTSATFWTRRSSCA